ncbi:MAG: methylmalonyl Co-A mutase-associated GTPase MeaB [Chitinophagales bacterium]
MSEKTKHSAAYYIDGIVNKDRIIFSKAITIIESTNDADKIIADEILQACIAIKKQSKRIAISGVPGAGKSTFINALGKLLIHQNHTLAILAIDPSSSISKGSILGDKTRMEDLVSHEKVFIRPTATAGNLGGIAKKTRETILLCEAFGFDYILVETVGVGQSETLVKNMVDLFILLLLPNAGDELQAVKRGIMEMADVILINKSEKENEIAAKTTAVQVKNALHLLAANENGWLPQVQLISATENIGLDKTKEIIDSYFLKMETTNFVEHNRKNQDLFWFESSVLEELQKAFYQNSSVQKIKDELAVKIKNNEITAVQAAKFLVDKFLEQ